MGGLAPVHRALDIDWLAALAGDVDLQRGRVPAQSPHPGKRLNRPEKPRLR